MTDEKASPPATMDVEKDVKKYVDPTLQAHAQDADEALKAFQDFQGETIDLDEATNKRLLRIIDWHMMPIMCLVYGMNYLDSMLCIVRLHSWYLPY
jgi:ACS family allantoate permease-like MFS transporter